MVFISIFVRAFTGTLWVSVMAISLSLGSSVTVTVFSIFVGFFIFMMFSEEYVYVEFLD